MVCEDRRERQFSKETLHLRRISPLTCILAPDDGRKSSSVIICREELQLFTLNIRTRDFDPVFAPKSEDDVRVLCSSGSEERRTPTHPRKRFPSSKNSGFDLQLEKRRTKKPHLQASILSSDTKNSPLHLRSSTRRLVRRSDRR